MSISSEIQKLKTTKANIKKAIIDKGQEVGEDFSTYADAISNIVSDFETETLTVTPSTIDIVNTPTTDGFSKVTVKAVTSSIDSNIKASNIKSGVSILGVKGSLIEGTVTSGTKEITSNGTYDISSYSKVSVSVPIGILEGLLNSVYYGYNPVDVSNLRTVENDLNSIYEGGND